MNERMKEFNWVVVFEKEMELNHVEFDENCKFKEKHRMIKDSPWIFNKEISVGDRILEGCTEYHKYFSGNGAAIGFIHSYCHDCYKVVVKPRTVTQLFQLCDLQKEMGHPAKCGIEIRKFVPCLYGGYFYNRSLDAGRECLRKVKKAVRTQIDPSMGVILKRGCTEFEMRFGPSDKWKVLPEQLKFEEAFREVYVKDMPNSMEMPDYLKSHIKTRWLHWAAQHYDKTYKDFTNGISLIGECDYVTYHKEGK